MANTLRDDINEVVAKRLQKAWANNEMVNVPDWVDELVQSLADVILQQDKAEHTRLVAHAMQKLGEYVTDGYS